VGPVREHQVHLGIKGNLHIKQHCYVAVRTQPTTATTKTTITTTQQLQGLYKETTATIVCLTAHNQNCVQHQTSRNVTEGRI
jgi:hypothetical protein